MIFILSRSMEANILESKKDLYLVQKYGGRYFAKVKRIYILSRSMEADVLQKQKGSISCPEVWRPIFCEGKKDLYLVQKLTYG